MLIFYKCFALKNVTQDVIAAITDQKVRAVVSTTGSVSAMVGCVACGIGTSVCAGTGWEQKAVICAQGVGICAGIATGMYEGNPTNPLQYLVEWLPKLLLKLHKQIQLSLYIIRPTIQYLKFNIWKLLTSY